MPVGRRVVATATWHEAVVSLKMKHMEESFSRYDSMGCLVNSIFMRRGAAGEHESSVANFAQAVLKELPIVPLCRGDTAYPIS
jgi:hypothetical protein